MIKTLLCNRYRLMEKVGEGSHSVVFKGWDKEESRFVAIKRLKTDGLPDDEAREVRDLFFREINILKKIKHEAIPHAYDFFVHGDQYYFVMEWVEGEDLLSILKRKGKLSEIKARNYLNQLTYVLTYLQKEGTSLIHKDIKPSNIIVCRFGRIKILDFGIARYHSPDKKKDTHELGTPGYASPEAYMGVQTDMSSDIYSVGVTFYHMVTGEEPLQFNFNFPSPREFTPELSEEFSQLLLDCLKNRKDRIIDAAQLRGRLSGHNQKFCKTLIKTLILLYVCLAAAAMAPDTVGFLAENMLSVGVPTYYRAIKILYYILLASSAVTVFITVTSKKTGKYLLKFIVVFLFVFYLQTAYAGSENAWRKASAVHFQNSENIQKAILEYAADNNNRFPGNLDELVPRYIKSIPACPFAGKEIYNRIYLMCRNRSSFFKVSMDYTGKDPAGLLHLSGTSMNYGRSVQDYTKCKENLKRIHLALEKYRKNNWDKYPEKLDKLVPGYIPEIPVCSFAGMESYSLSYTVDSERLKYTIYCPGHNHQGMGVEMNYPQYTSTGGLKRSEKYEKCRKNLNIITVALKRYASDNDGRYPRKLNQLTPGYLLAIPTCPTAHKDTYSASYQTDADGNSFNLCCKGTQHMKLGVARDFPCKTLSDDDPMVELEECRENIYFIFFALCQYAKNNNGFPKKLEDLVPEYLPEIPQCHGGAKDTYSGSYVTNRESNLFTYYCRGCNHIRAGVAEDFPKKTFRVEIVTGYIKDEKHRKCRENLKDIEEALVHYRSENYGRYPQKLQELVPEYIKSIPVCPAAGVDTYSESYNIDYKKDRTILFCSGFHHSKLGCSFSGKGANHKGTDIEKPPPLFTLRKGKVIKFNRTN